MIILLVTVASLVSDMSRRLSYYMLYRKNKRLARLI